MFNVVIGAALVFGGCLLVSATYGEAPLLASRTAAQITGWLCVAALLVDLCAMTLRSHGLRHLPRPTFGQAVAGVTTMLTGALMLYVSYFEWSELPAVPMRQAAAAVLPAQLPRGMPDASFIPAAFYLPKAEAYQPVAALRNLPAAPRRPATQLVASAMDLHAAEAACSLLGGFSRLWCVEQMRLEYCADRQGADLVCPSPIPTSPPY